jgi:hypothetical protein
VHTDLLHRRGGSVHVLLRRLENALVRIGVAKPPRCGFERGICVTTVDLCGPSARRPRVENGYSPSALRLL